MLPRRPLHAHMLPPPPPSPAPLFWYSFLFPWPSDTLSVLLSPGSRSRVSSSSCCRIEQQTAVPSRSLLVSSSSSLVLRTSASPNVPRNRVTSIPCISCSSVRRDTRYHLDSPTVRTYVRIYVRVVWLGTAAKNESQYVHDKIYTEMSIRATVRLHPFSSFPSVLFSLKTSGKETRAVCASLLYGHSACAGRHPRPSTSSSSSCKLSFSAQGSAIPMGLLPPRCSRYAFSTVAISQHDKSFQPGLRSRFSLSFLAPLARTCIVCLSIRSLLLPTL